MILIPYQNFYIISPLKPEEVKLRINDNLAPDKGVFSPVPILFKKKLKSNEFEIVPRFAGQNSFTPKIRGIVDANLSGSRIQITATLFRLVLILLLLMCSIVTIISINHLTKVGSIDQPIIAKYLPFVAVLFLYGFAIVIFRKGTRKAKVKLLEILNGQQEKIN